MFSLQANSWQLSESIRAPVWGCLFISGPLLRIRRYGVDERAHGSLPRAVRIQRHVRVESPGFPGQQGVESRVTETGGRVSRLFAWNVVKFP